MWKTAVDKEKQAAGTGSKSAVKIAGAQVSPLFSQYCTVIFVSNGPLFIKPLRLAKRQLRPCHPQLQPHRTTMAHGRQRMTASAHPLQVTKRATSVSKCFMMPWRSNQASVGCVLYCDLAVCIAYIIRSIRPHIAACSHGRRNSIQGLQGDYTDVQIQNTDVVR
jgi:hypothetical protein